MTSVCLQGYREGLWHACGHSYKRSYIEYVVIERHFVTRCNNVEPVYDVVVVVIVIVSDVGVVGDIAASVVCVAASISDFSRAANAVDDISRSRHADIKRSRDADIAR